MIQAILLFITRWKWLLIAAGASLAFIAGFHARTLIYEAREAKELAQEIKAHQEEEQRAYTHAAELEKELASLRKENAILTESAKNEVKLTIYHACKLPATGRLLLRKAASRLAAS